MKHFFLSFFAGLVVAFVAVAAVAWFTIAPRIAEVRNTWALKSVVVMQQDLPVGESITFDTLTQRYLPAQFVTDSMVAPDDVSGVVNRPAPVPLKAGDVLLWGMFADHSATDACFTSIIAKVRAAGEAARADAISRFGERVGAPLPTPDPVPALKADASGEVSVVVAATEIAEGKVIDASMLTVGKFPKNMVTASFVPAEQLRDIVGTRAVVPLQPKDAMMWQLLDDADRPRRAISCASEAGTAMDEARKSATREEAAAFTRGKETP